jgi:long-chain acyl-CoA synthetase
MKSPLINLAARLEYWALKTPLASAIWFEGKDYSYALLDATSTRLASSLVAAGLKAGDRIGIYLPNTPEFALAYFAIQKAGMVPVSINAIFKSAEVEFLINDSGARLVFTTEELALNVPIARCPGLKWVLVAEGEQQDSMNSWSTRGDAEFNSRARAANAPAALLYSSGTTGTPKGVILTAQNVWSNIQVAAKYAGYRPGDKLATFLPLFHVYGQNFILLGSVFAGSCVALFRRFVPDLVLPAIKREGITCFFGVPTIFINLLASPLSPETMSSVRFYMSAAATMPEEISRRWFEKFGQRIYEGYGLTECAPFAAYNDLQEHRFGSVGRAVDDFQIAIFDESERAVATGDWGEIVIKGPGVMAGYWGRPEDTEVALRGGWLHSGDIGRMDEDGYVFIVDRVKDMINVSGFKVWPAEVEQYLYKIPGVIEVAVYGLPDANKGERVAVAMVIDPASSVTAQSVMEYCRQNIAAYKVPAQVDIVNELPKSATGKILKRVLRQDSVKLALAKSQSARQ